MLMKTPPHPGRIVRQECIEPLGLTVTAAAKGLGVTRKALSELVNGKSGISPEMAIRLSKAFGSSPEVWLGIQMDYELARMQRKGAKIRVQRLRAGRLIDWRRASSRTAARRSRSTSSGRDRPTGPPG